MVKKKFPEVEARLFRNMYVCMRCNAKIRASLKKINLKKIKCRKCGSKDLRLKSKDIKT